MPLGIACHMSEQHMGDLEAAAKRILTAKQEELDELAGKLAHPLRRQDFVERETETDNEFRARILRLLGVAEKPKRANWDKYFMGIAAQVATRSTCDRKHVGAVLVRDRQILSTGYNGSVRGLPHCDDAGHLMIDGHCQRTVHAESNAVAQAAREGVRIRGATAYVTINPCWTCLRLLANAGIELVIFGEVYGRPVLPEQVEREGEREAVIVPTFHVHTAGSADAWCAEQGHGVITCPQPPGSGT
jgi:dCMP deaminase